MAGFVLKNTLSDNGGVTRGICKMDEDNNLTEVVETKNIVKTADGAEADGVAVDVNSLVSMNMWGLTPEFLDVLEEGFKEFFEKEVRIGVIILSAVVLAIGYYVVIGNVYKDAVALTIAKTPVEISCGDIFKTSQRIFM